jgi:hypothetical protein
LDLFRSFPSTQSASSSSSTRHNINSSPARGSGRRSLKGGSRPAPDDPSLSSEDHPEFLPLARLRSQGSSTQDIWATFLPLVCLHTPIRRVPHRSASRSRNVLCPLQPSHSPHNISCTRRLPSSGAHECTIPPPVSRLLSPSCRPHFSPQPGRTGALKNTSKWTGNCLHGFLHVETENAMFLRSH